MDLTFKIKIDLASLSEKEAGEHSLKIRLSDDQSKLKNDFILKIIIEWEEKEEEVVEEKPKPVAPPQNVFRGVVIEERDKELKEKEE